MIQFVEDLNAPRIKTWLAMGVVAIVALIIIAIVGLPGPAERKPDTKPEEDKNMVSHIKTPDQLAAAVTREGSQVWIEGVPNEHVGGGWLAIPRGVALLLKHRGEDVDLDDAIAYSGDAFHLSIATKWQYMGYMAIRTNPVANILAAYGYDGGYHHTEPMPAGDPEAIRAITDGLLAEYYAKIDAGRPVLVGGVSDEGCGSWSVVTGYNQDALQLYHVGLDESPRWSNIRGINAPLNDETFESGCWNSQVRGTVWPGMIGHWLDNCGVYLGDKVAEPSARETALKTLALAVQLHRAADHDGLWMTYFGASAYEQWARALHELDYPADTLKPVPEPLWDVYSLRGIARLPEAIAVGRSAAAKFCEKAAKDLPEAKDHLLAAATAYRQEAAIAQEAFAVLLSGPDDRAEAWLSDEANREAGVTAIAQMLEKDELAVRHIQAALAAASIPAAPTTGRTTSDLAATVTREGGKVWIEDVPNMPVGGGAEWDGLLKGLHLLMTHRGEDMTLEELMALSGDAFHICFGAEWQERTTHSIPTDPLANAARALGYEGRWTSRPRHHGEFVAMTPEARDTEARQFLQEVHSQIDAGMPVLFGGVYGVCGDWRAAVGYDPAEDLICYVGGDKPYDWTEVYDEKVRSDEFGYWDVQFRGTVYGDLVGGWLGNAAFLLGAKTREAPEAERIVTALRRAVELHHAQPRQEYVTFYFGARAYEQWAAELHDLDYPLQGAAAQRREDEPECYDFSTMGYLADQIVRGRSAARAFCERAAEVFPQANDDLLAAAWAYREETTIVVKMFGVFLTGTEAEREAWLSDEAKREAGVTAIGQMLEKEQLAVGHIEAALAIVSAAGPGPPIAVGGQPMQAVQPTPVFDIPKLADMDASASPEQWGNRGFRVDVMTPFGPRMPTSQFGARFRLGWDDTGLWLLATVTDDEFHSAESIEKFWANEADLILLYVIREKGEFARILIEPGMTADQPSPRTITDGGGNSLGVRVTRETIDGGYMLQAWAPWSEVGFEPAEGAELRAQVIVLDVDGAGEDIQMGGALWYPATGTPNDTNISHRLRLADQPSPPQVAVVRADDDRITVTAVAEHVGKAVTVVEGGRTLVETMLTIDDATGYAVASIPLPLPPLSSPIARPTVMLDGQAIAALNPLQLHLDDYAVRGHNYDTLSMALVAAAKALGRDADFEAVVCLSSNAFAPMLDTGETCTAWWMCQAWQADRCIETVAGRLGLSIRKLDLPEAEGTWDDADAMAAHRRQIAPILRKAMDGGEIIVTTGGWEAWQQHGLVPWCWAGIITEARDDGTILGAFVNGRTDNVIYHPYTMYAISPAEPTLAAHEADLIMLQQAVNRIRSTERFESDELSRYGLAAMDVWIAQMKKVPYCDPCHESQPNTGPTGCAYSSASPVYSGAQFAAGYLRRRIGTFKVEARWHIEAAARHYDRIYLLLHPALTGQGGRNYSQIVGNQQLQNAHAEVLLAVKSQLAAAADAMARALAAEGVEVTYPVAPIADDPAFALTEEFTAEQLTELAAWSNLYGNLEVVLREAATNPELLELFRQQLGLGSLSGEAATIRGYIGRLEPAEDTYLTHVDNIVRAIAAGEWGEGEQPFFMPGREAQLEVLRGILADWVDGVSLADAKSKATSKTETIAVQRIYGLLGEHTNAKAEAVAGLVGKFSPDGDCDDVFYEWEAMRDKTTVAQKMAHHITMLDKPLWHLEYSLSVTLAGIGHGESIGDWRTPGGHLGWMNWANPKDLPRLKLIAEALEVWLADAEAEGEVGRIVAALGERDAYREKVWLAGCLLHYLRVGGQRSHEFAKQLETDWLPLGPEGFTMDELTDSLVTGDIGWYWPRPIESE